MFLGAGQHGHIEENIMLLLKGRNKQTNKHKSSYGTGERAELDTLPEVLGSIPRTTGQLTTVCNSSSRGSDTLIPIQIKLD